MRDVDHITNSVKVGHLATPLAEALTFGPDHHAEAALRQLRENRFDQAPVMLNGHPTGFVVADQLVGVGGTVGEVAKPTLPGALVSAASPLRTALPHLERSGFLFLLDHDEITGFVVPSDLNKQAGRAYFYLGLVELELGLARVVRQLEVGDDVLLDSLSSKEAELVRQRHLKKRRANVEADITAELTLAQLFTVVEVHSALPARLGLSAAEWREHTRPINSRLRRTVAHVAGSVLTGAADLEDVLKLDQRVHDLVAGIADHELDLCA